MKLKLKFKKEFFFKYTYKTKLTILISACIFIPFVILCISGMTYFSKIKKERRNEQYKTTELTALRYLEDTINDVYNKITYLSGYNTLCTFLSTITDFSLSETVTYSELINDIVSSLFPESDFQKLAIYTTNLHIYNTKYITKTPDDIFKDIKTDGPIIQRIEKSGNEYVLKIYKKYSYYDNNKHTIVVTIPFKKIFHSSNIYPNNNFELYYKDTRNNIFVPISQQLDENITSEEITKNSYCSFSSPYLNGEFFIYNNVQREELPFSIIILIFALIFVVIAILIAFFINILVYNLTYRLTSIVSEIKLNDIKTPPYSKNKDSEFDIIHKKLYDLFLQLKVENERILELELDLLNQKISPHFLYNNLSVIKWKYDDEKLNGTIDRLITYYRNIFQKSTALITIGEELENVRNYVSLLKFAYDQEFLFETVIDEKLSEYYLPSNILQTLTENSFLHSINNVEADDCFIKIIVCEEKENLIIKVINNYSEENSADNINKYLEKNDKQSAITIIQKRLLLHYGEQFKLSYFNEGTVLTSKIKLPKERRKTKDE